MATLDDCVQYLMNLLLDDWLHSFLLEIVLVSIGKRWYGMSRMIRN
jgi:hypothetical protein